MAEVQSLQSRAGDKTHGTNDLAFWEENDSCVSLEKSLAIIETKGGLPAVVPSITHSLWRESSSSNTPLHLITTWLLLMMIDPQSHDVYRYDLCLVGPPLSASLSFTSHPCVCRVFLLPTEPCSVKPQMGKLELHNLPGVL